MSLERQVDLRATPLQSVLATANRLGHERNRSILRLSVMKILLCRVVRPP